ncbi:zinc finger protein 354A-like isoform X2 [Bombus pyrosoma]|uniref:zinc finger protein 354A-like isoform X2 n=1 Tax=Bombus pyrosoma TaxID=396416 RepID=UPI001CB949E3|nr:zinc finger protein 354A-like isoform X2 [Bombus pyrosoma]
MELGEGDAQICRLCGQCESIYIDVFGEEGTKRFLGLKIHTKINILIKKNDGLPQIVCLRCLGILEFFCDFYDRCHLVQQEFLQASQNITDEKFQQDSDAESDKENAVPSANEMKRKAKALSPESLKGTKNYLSENNTSYYRTERKEENVNLVNNSPINDVHSVTQTTVHLSNVISCEKISGSDQRDASNLEENTNNLKHKNLNDNISKKTAICTRPTNNLKRSQKDEEDISINTYQPVGRRKGRKSKLTRMRGDSFSAGSRKKKKREEEKEKIIQNDMDKSDSLNSSLKNLDNKCKRSCLHVIYDNDKSNSVINNIETSSKPQVEQEAVKEQVAVVDTSSNIIYTKVNEPDIVYINNENHHIGDDLVINKLREMESDGKSTEKPGSYLNNTEDWSAKSKAISVIVKQEKGEAESTPPSEAEKTNQLVLIPNEILIQKDKTVVKNHDQKGEKVDLTRISCSLEEESEKTENSETNLVTVQNIIKDSDVSNNPQSKILTKQNRVTVIRSSQSNELSNPKMMQEDSTEPCIAIDVIDQSTTNEIECNLSKRSLSRVSKDGFNKIKSKDRSFGKISELISDEQKQAIETYYTVDMSIVNLAEVQKNMTIINKKNIRCNICGSLYLRMDKCQVHIWGHLQMKPYQCKACDFATVTVTNVRCHIRKSHLKIKPFACHLCEKRYVNAILLEEHINTHTGARPYKCKLCDFASSSRQILSYHNATHKPMKDISCKLCGKEFYSKSRLRAHMIVHNKDKAVMCKLCSAYLSNAEALETHHRNIHMQDYVCNICGKHTKSRKALHNHQNVHAAAKYKCTLCPNVYKSSQILKEHLLKHEGIRKYKCNVCEKSFGQQSHLAAHMAVHSKIRFHCPGCDKPFNRLDNMKIHTKRCKPFLANPELKNLLSRRERTISFNNIAELTAELKTGNMANSMSQVSLENQNDEMLVVKTVEDEQKTALNLCKLGLNISCFEPTEKTWNSDKMYNEEVVMKSSEINAIKVTNINDRLIPENENVLILENILGPENY